MIKWLRYDFGEIMNKQSFSDMSRPDPVIFHRIPRLKRPVMLAAWPGVSDVALEVAAYLIDKLEAREFAELDPTEFFIPVGIQVQDNVVQVPVFPENKFFFVKTPKGKSDIVIFCGEAQPDTNHYDLALAVLKVAQKLKIRRIYTCAAAMVQHSVQKSRVLAAATDAGLIPELKQYDITLVGDFQIRGLNGLLLGAAREHGIEGICILGETPQYAAEMPNPIASYAVLGTLSKVFSLDIDLTDIAKDAKQMTEEMKMISQEFMTKYINHFTQPIWERNPSQDFDEYEDDDEYLGEDN